MLFILSIFFISLVSAEKINDINPLEGISDKGIKYDKEILDNFNLTNIEKDYFIKGDLKKFPKKEIDWVHVMVKVKDFSNITIPHRTSPDFESKKDERWEIYRETSDTVLSTLSPDEFRLKSKSEFGRSFSGNITKKGFDKLLDEPYFLYLFLDELSTDLKRLLINRLVIGNNRNPNIVISNLLSIELKELNIQHVVYNGKILADRYISSTRFLNILRKDLKLIT